MYNTQAVEGKPSGRSNIKRNFERTKKVLDKKSKVMYNKRAVLKTTANIKKEI